MTFGFVNQICFRNVFANKSDRSFNPKYKSKSDDFNFRDNSSVLGSNSCDMSVIAEQSILDDEEMEVCPRTQLEPGVYLYKCFTANFTNMCQPET